MPLNKTYGIPELTSKQAASEASARLGYYQVRVGVDKLLVNDHSKLISASLQWIPVMFLLQAVLFIAPKSL